MRLTTLPRAARTQRSAASKSPSRKRSRPEGAKRKNELSDSDDDEDEQGGLRTAAPAHVFIDAQRARTARSCLASPSGPRRALEAAGA